MCRTKGPALTDLLAGQVDMMIAVTASALPYVKSGRLRALAVTGDTRSAVAPALPTLAESGVAGYEFKTWYGIQAPARTPSTVISTLNAKVSEILGRPDVVEQLAAVGLEAKASTPAEFGALIESEIRKWARVVKASGARID